MPVGAEQDTIVGADQDSAIAGGEQGGDWRAAQPIFAAETGFLAVAESVKRPSSGARPDGSLRVGAHRQHAIVRQTISCATMSGSVPLEPIKASAESAYAKT